MDPLASLLSRVMIFDGTDVVESTGVISIVIWNHIDKIVTAQCYTLGQVGLRSVMNVYESGKACSASRWDVLLRIDPWPTVVVFDLILKQILFCKLVEHRIRGFNPKKKLCS